MRDITFEVHCWIYTWCPGLQRITIALGIFKFKCLIWRDQLRVLSVDIATV